MVVGVTRKGAGLAIGTQAGEVGVAQAAVAGLEDVPPTLRRPSPGSTQEVLAAGAVEVDREALAVLQRPGELRIEPELGMPPAPPARISSTVKP